MLVHVMVNGVSCVSGMEQSPREVEMSKKDRVL